MNDTLSATPALSVADPAGILETYQRVLRVLREEDPEGLIRIGAPRDEYMPEASDITERIFNDEVIDAEVVRDVFAYWFETKLMNPARAARIARRVNYGK